MSRAIKTLKGVFLSAWGGGKTTLLTVVVALSLATLTPAFGATGGNFILGKSNVATTFSRLTANVAGAPALQIFNTNTAPASTALNLVVAAGHPPLWVNPTAGKATNLNADKVDGKDSSAFLAADRFGGTSAGNNPQGGSLECILGEVHLFAGDNINPPNWRLANGDVLLINQNQALFSIIGTTYGGNGTTNFALPDMRGLEPDGVRYFICVQGIFP